MDSERAANKYKQVEYMKEFVGDEFEGVISGVAAFGFWVETVEHKCEGLVSLNSLMEYDDFRLIESDYAWWEGAAEEVSGWAIKSGLKWFPQIWRNVSWIMNGFSRRLHLSNPDFHDLIT